MQIISNFFKLFKRSGLSINSKIITSEDLLRIQSLEKRLMCEINYLGKAWGCHPKRKKSK